MIDRPYSDHRSAALALLNGTSRQTRKAARFLGQITFDPSPLTEAQAEWLAKLLDRAGLPPFDREGAQ